MIITINTGCSIGTKTKHSTVFVKPTPIPEAVKGAPIIATNQKIKLAILNIPDKTFEKDIGGYVVVDQDFYKLLIESYKNDRSTRKTD